MKNEFIFGFCLKLANVAEVNFFFFFNGLVFVIVIVPLVNGKAVQFRCYKQKRNLSETRNLTLTRQVVLLPRVEYSGEKAGCVS